MSEFLDYDVSMSLKVVCNLDSDEMLPYAAFHLGLHCLNCQSTFFQVSRMKRIKQ